MKMFQGINYSRSSTYRDKRFRRRTHNAGSTKHYTQHFWPKPLSDAHDGVTRHRQYRRCSLLTYPVPSTTWRTATPTRITLTCVRPPRAPNTGAPCPISPTSGYIYTRRLCTARMYGHIHGWDVASWRGSGESKRIRGWKNRRSPSLLRHRIVLRRATSRPRWCRVCRRDMLSSCSRDHYVWWQAGSTRSRQGQVILDIHDVFTWFVRL
jgi:hypothetical protein